MGIFNLIKDVTIAIGEVLTLPIVVVGDAINETNNAEENINDILKRIDKII